MFVFKKLLLYLRTKVREYRLHTIEEPLSETMIKEFHRILKTGTADAQKSNFNVGEYKMLANEVGGRETCKPEWYDGIYNYLKNIGIKEI